MRRLLVGLLVSVVMVLAPGQAFALCNCDSGHLICTITDGNGNYAGYIFVRDASVCN